MTEQGKAQRWIMSPWMFPAIVRGSIPMHDGSKTTTTTPKESQVDVSTFEDAALFIANRPLPPNFEELWNHTSHKVCADGGANRLYDWALSQEKVDLFIPSILVGDLDSARNEVVEFYKAKNVEIFHIAEQDSTDFDKALKAFFARYPDWRTLIVTGALGGNLSQEMANYHSCYDYCDKQISFVGTHNVHLFLPKGSHILSCSVGHKCGILPIGEPCRSCTTTGLRWNLNNDELKFGGMISTSNVTTKPEVTLSISESVLWTFDYDGS